MWALEEASLSSDPGSVTSWLSDLKQVTELYLHICKMDIMAIPISQCGFEG